MKPYHVVKDISVRNGRLSLEIDGKTHIFDLANISDLLANASAEEASTYEVSPAGYGIHWPLIDEDISIDGLLGVQHSPNSERRSA